LQKITIFLFYFLCFVNSRIFCARCTIPALFAGGKLPALLCSISMGRKSGGYSYYIKELPQSKPVGFASSLGEGAFGMTGKFPAEV